MDRRLSQIRQKQNKATMDADGIIGKRKSGARKKEITLDDASPASVSDTTSGFNNTVDTLLAAGTAPSDMIKTLDNLVPRSETEAEIKEGAKRYWSLVEQFHELYGVYPWEVVHTLHPKDRIGVNNSGSTKPNDPSTQEDPYVRKQRELKASTGVQFSEKDIKTVETLVKQAKAKGQVASNHEQFIAEALEGGHINPREASAARFMLRYMDSLRIVGNEIRTIYNQLDVSNEVGLQQGVQALSSFIGEELLNNFIGNRVNGLRTGGVYNTWTNLDQLTAYLNRAIETFENAFNAAIESGKPGRLFRLVQILNANEWNIEKYIGLLQRAQFNIYDTSTPFGFLANALYESPTSQGGKGGDGQAALKAALDTLYTQKHLPSRFTEEQIIDYDYTHTADDFKHWLRDNGYTHRVIKQAVAAERSYSSIADAKPITDQDIDKLLKSYEVLE
ncbi:hypothetical protein [Microscilla marina]|uniref:Uncharacterized protein n=1 Tax=Microscilla marina ATCC 23134 TaxID=313606 RepID=A1ZTU1_MICM2|nr:hypothetical protein [Microscilla marina]EAY26193.1 hypothetical protein M23134_02525 [Microscilla marina ATCC 23134]